MNNIRSEFEEFGIGDQVLHDLQSVSHYWLAAHFMTSTDAKLCLDITPAEMGDEDHALKCR